VWTSVRKRYFSVEASSPARKLEPLTGALESAAAGKTGVEDVGRSINLYPILSESYRTSMELKKFISGHKNLAGSRKNRGSHLLVSLYSQFFSCQKENS